MIKATMMMMIIILSVTFYVEANTEIMKENLSSFSSSCLAATVTDTDYMIARAIIVHTNNI